MNKSATAQLLGCLGLLPFPGLLAMAFIGTGGIAVDPMIALSLYASLILSFLVGAWWGMALLRNRPALLVLSNVVVVFTWLFLVLFPTLFPTFAALLFIMVYAVEQAHPMFEPQPAYYRRLRFWLTLVAVLCLLGTSFAPWS